MPRKKGGFGPGAMKMGGAGIKPTPPRTAMAGRPAGGPPGGLPGGLGGGLGGGPPPGPRPLPMPGGQAVARSPAAGMGGASGFKKGGEAEKKREEHEKLAHGGTVGNATQHAFERGGSVGREGVGEHHEGKGQNPGNGRMEKAPFGPRKGYAKGGMVGGGDAKGRVGRDRGGAGKAC